VAEAEKAAETRAPNTIESEIEATRERLASTIDLLVYRANPKTIAKRKFANVKATFVDAQGSPRTGNILKVVGGVAGFVTVLVTIRKVAN